MNVNKMRFLLVSCMFVAIYGRKHYLVIKEDDRELIGLSTFGFLVGGELRVDITNFQYVTEKESATKPAIRNNTFGFTLDKTPSGSISPKMEGSNQCLLNDEMLKKDDSISVIFFRLDMEHDPPCLWIDRKGKDVTRLKIVPKEIVPKTTESSQASTTEASADDDSADDDSGSERKRRNAETDGSETPDEEQDPDTEEGKSIEPSSSTQEYINIGNNEGSDDDDTGETADDTEPLMHYIPVQQSEKGGPWSVSFTVYMRKEQEEGLYNLQFHNCMNDNTHKQSRHLLVNFTMHIAEKNGDNYLSAGDTPLPALFFLLCLVYFTLSAIWFLVLKRATEGVFKTHFLMLGFLVVKGLSLLFHSIDYHFIQVNGQHGEAFAILYYITYLMKGTLLFVTILLVGAGWSFVKHLLSTREKKLFIIVIPLQILANVAQVIIQETEEGTSEYTTWKMIFLMLDLLCCGAILFPVVWSIRHLQDASQTDGKAAINLAKLKIFRHFYILVVCYIYSTRIITYLLAITLPFHYVWLCFVFKEAANLVFFVLTGYKFRPASDNPYLQLPMSDTEDEMEEVITKGGATEGVTRVNQREPIRDSHGMETTSLTTPKQRESSHEYD